MGNRRFGLTTYVLVAISLVGLYFVAKTVTPPPPGPPQEKTATPPANAPAPSKEVTQAMQKEQMQQQAQQESMALKRSKQIAAATKAGKTDPTKKPFNPTAIDTDSPYWQQADMGKKGTQEIQAKVKKALEEQKSQPVAKPATMQKAIPVPAP